MDIGQIPLDFCFDHFFLEHNIDSDVIQTIFLVICCVKTICYVSLAMKCVLFDLSRIFERHFGGENIGYIYGE